MSLTSLVCSSDASFKLSQKLVASLAEKFSFKFEDGWSTVCSRTVEHVQKRMRRAKKLASPMSDVKHPRTAYSFFTSEQRPLEQKAHPEATFGQLSGYVSVVWKSLTPEQQQPYKVTEAADKVRYQTQRAKALVDSAAAAAVAATAVDTSTTVVSDESVIETPVVSKPKKVSKPKATAASDASPACVPATCVVDACVAPVCVVEKQPKVKSPKAKAAPAPAAAAPAAAPAAPAPAPAAPAPAAPAPVAAAPAPVAAAPAAPAAVVMDTAPKTVKSKKVETSSVVVPKVDVVKASSKKTIC
jgi:hypothetical protein